MTKRQILQNMYRKSVTVMLVGILTGLTVGVVVTFFALATEVLSEHSYNIYASVQARPAFVPLLFLVLAVGAFMVATLNRFLPMLGSNGVPQTEGVTRGLLKMKWYQMLPAMAAASLISIFMGLSAGAEGPCMFIGGMCGDAVSRPFGSTDMERRYQITGGACAGVAVAANAPLTGIVFALEEAHRRFTPSILICSFSAVISAVITRNLLHLALGLEIESELIGFKLAHMPAIGYLYVALAALASGLVGVLFFYLVKFGRKRIMKITALKGGARYLIPFLFAGAAGLITVYATGGGHSLINMLATNGGEGQMSLGLVFGTPIAATLVIIIVLRLVSLVLGISTGVPGGIFVPIISLGALVGALMSRLLVIMGMDAAFTDYIVLISMATIFAATVKAPLTAIIFVVEFTWQSTLLLPVVLGVFIGYMFSEIFSVKPLYDFLLEDMEERFGHGMKRGIHEYTTRVRAGSLAAGKPLGDMLWQEGTSFKLLERGGDAIVPGSDTVLQVGDKLTMCAEVNDPENFDARVEEIVSPINHLNKLRHTGILHILSTIGASDEDPSQFKQEASSLADGDPLADIEQSVKDNETRAENAKTSPKDGSLENSARCENSDKNHSLTPQNEEQTADSVVSGARSQTQNCDATDREVQTATVANVGDDESPRDIASVSDDRSDKGDKNE